jgi:chromosome segregation ATPase
VKEGEEYEQSIRSLQIRYEESTRRVHERKNNLEVVYQESTPELHNLLSNFDDSMAKRVSELRGLQRNISNINEEIAHKRSVCDDLNVQRGHANSVQNLLESEQKKLSDESTTAARQYGISAPAAQRGSTWSTSSSKQFIKNLENKVN